jgi:hypothetical protein
MNEVADVFKKYGEVYREKYSLSPSMSKVMSAIEACRTASLGGHVDKCESCGHVRILYNSCRNRHCPKCQSLAKEKWLEERKKDLLPIQYFHVVFTIPDLINDLALRNKREIYKILFKASAETLNELSRDLKYLGAKVGFISVLHTWGQNLMEHPHIHCIVTGGGLSKDEKKWCESRQGFFIPVKVMSRLFRGKFLYYLKKEYLQRKLKFVGQIKDLEQPDYFEAMLTKLYTKEWIVFCKPPFGGSESVLNYLGRYTHRVAITNHRIVKLEDGKVTFKYRDYKDHNKNKLMILDACEFIRRFMLHILPDRFVKIRYYGLLSNKNRKKQLRLCKKLLGIQEKNLERMKAKETWEEMVFRLTGKDCTVCPICKGQMKRERDIQEIRRPSKFLIA